MGENEYSTMVNMPMECVNILANTMEIYKQKAWNLVMESEVCVGHEPC